MCESDLLKEIRKTSASKTPKQQKTYPVKTGAAVDRKVTEVRIDAREGRTRLQ
jgi:hypothetical protein